MPSSERDEETAFIPPQPFVSDAENNRRYIFYLTDNEDDEVDPIEKMYGPFEDALDTVPPYPKPYARRAKTADRIREEEILRLREAIRDMEQQKAQNMETKKLQEIKQEWEASQKSNSKRPHLSFEENKQRRILSQTIVIDSDTDDAIEAEVVHEEEEEEDQLQSREQSATLSSTEDDNMQSESDLHEDSDSDSFQSAQDVMEESDPELQMMKGDAAKLEMEMQNLNTEMKTHVKQKDDIKLKLLGIKVKISIEKNRKELTGKRTGAQASSSSPPLRLGMKRTLTDEHLQADPRPWRSAQPAAYHTMPTAPLVPTQPLAFSQQILPPHMPQHFVHPTMYTNGYDTTYMNGLSPAPLPPPPPPNTMPPYIPPPPVFSETMSPAYSPTYNSNRNNNRKRARRNGNGNRHDDGWNTTPTRFNAKAPVVSPYADLTSPISRMEDADTVQNALVHLNDLISVRVFGDEKHNAFSATAAQQQERYLPKIRRLITLEKRIFAAPLDNNQQDEKTSNNIVFLSPAGLPAQLQITDASHESPFLGLLYRRFQEKPFANAMEFAVPSIFSWIPQDVDLSTLYSNEFGGMPLYADKLTETYNMVCDLSSAYPGTEFLGALKLELSMYVNGRESETFMHDCQACIAQYKDSIDVFWQIVLAEADRAKQISLIQDHVKSIRVSSDTVTTVNSEKTTEILIRTLRLFGLTQVLELLSDGKMTHIDESEGGIVLLDQIQYVNDDGKYFIWMSILHYYVTHTLPEDVCGMWMRSLVKDGSPSHAKPLFTIDWRNVLKKHPVDGPTLRGATNILLSMLRYFGNAAIGNVNKKPLLIGVLSTLFSFTSCTKCYDLIGTLLLIQQLDSTSLARDVEDIRLDLKK